MRRLYYSDDEFSQAFNELKDYREVPPVGNWREIHARLDKRTTYSYTKLIRIAAMLAIFLSLGLGIYLSTETARERTQAIKRDNLSKPALVAEPIIKKPAVESVSNEVVTTPSTNPLEKIETSLQQIESGLVVLNLNREQDIIKPIKPIYKPQFVAPIKALDYHAYEMLTGFDDIENLRGDNFIQPISSRDFTSFYVGVNLQPQHTMLTSRASEDGKPVQQFSPGMAYGVSAGFRLSDAWALETGGLLSMENQRYEAMEEAREQTAKRMAKLNTETPVNEATMQQYHLALNYYRIPLMVKFSMPWSQRRSIREESVCLIGGVQYGYFRNGFNSNVDPTENEIKTDVVTEDIKRSDVQVLTGLERSSAVSRNFSISYGFKIGYGLRQISSLETERVTKFNRPHNMNAAFNIALTFSK